jgi:hypothetical protein
MSFLKQEHRDLLYAMSVLQTGTYTNKNGTQSKGKLFFIGENECTLSNAYYKLDKNNKAYIECVFTRKPEFVDGLKTKISFVRHSEFIFDYNRAKELCAAFGKELKEQRHDEDFNSYFRRVYKGVDTFIGRQLKVSVLYSKELKTDDYGEAVMRNVYYDRQDEVWFWRMKIDMFYNTNETMRFDYWKQSAIFAE